LLFHLETTHLPSLVGASTEAAVASAAEWLGGRHGIVPRSKGRDQRQLG
jgi:hypothetical protein